MQHHARRLTPLLLLAPVFVLLPAFARSDHEAGAAHLSQFGAGAGPSVADGVYRVLDTEGTFGQSNAVALDRPAEGAFEAVTLRGRVRVTEGGDGGAFLFLNTAAFGRRGPAPFVPSWVAPNLARTFAVGIDVHNPRNEEPFSEWGNYQGLPQREVSLHWDGREIVKRVADAEFRGDWAPFEIRVQHVSGGADVSVRIGEAQVYEHEFIAGLLPYEMRPAFGAGTRGDVATQFDVAELDIAFGEPAAPRRPPLHVDVFNHVLTDNSKTSFEVQVDLPPANWAFGRIILTLDIHDAGKDWDEWDRNGHLYVVEEDGTKWDIVPFITSYRRECHWEVDVTHFRPWLTGTTTFEIAAGTTFYKNRGYMLSVALDYHHGDALLGEQTVEPFAVVPLWHTTAHYRNDENHFADAFDEQRVAIPEDVIAARIATTTTGHSQIGEFTPSNRAIVFAPEASDVLATEAADASGGADAADAARHDSRAEAQRFENTLWKTDCYLNPIRPQFGTWKYARAGWAPGDVVHPWWIDLTPQLSPGETASIRYEPSPYDFSQLPEERRPAANEVGKASHVVRSYLILYRAPLDSVPAPILRVTNVVGGSAADKAGIKQGDYLASYDGTRIDSIDALGTAKTTATDAGKQQVAVVVYRGPERLELELATGQLGVNLSTR